MKRFIKKRKVTVEEKGKKPETTVTVEWPYNLKLVVLESSLNPTQKLSLRSYMRDQSRCWNIKDQSTLYMYFLDHHYNSCKCLFLRLDFFQNFCVQIPILDILKFASGKLFQPNIKCSEI